MRLSRSILLLCVVAALAMGCSGDGDDSGSADTTPADQTTAPSTSPIEIVVAEDTVFLGVDGIYDPNGAALLVFSPAEQACIEPAAESAGVVAEASPPRTFDDPEVEQSVAEIVVGCVAYDRIAGIVESQLAAESALEGVSETCLQREASSLQDTPDILASVLRGDPDTLSVIAGAASTNCD